MNQHQLLDAFPSTTTIPLEPYQLGEALSQVSTGYHSEAFRSTGINLTAGQHAQNLFFVSATWRMPLTVAEVRQMGWTRTDLPGVTPTDLAELFSDIRTLALMYRSHASDLMRVVQEYVWFAFDIQTPLAMAINAGWRILLAERSGDQLTPEDESSRQEMMRSIEWARGETYNQLTLCQKVSDNLGTYQMDLSRVTDRVDRSLNIIRTSESGKGENIDRINAEINELRQIRNELVAEYESIDQSLWVRGPFRRIIGMIVLRSIYGVRLTSLRQQIDQITDLKDAKIRELERVSAAQARLQEIGDFLFDTSSNLGETSTSITDLVGSWLELESYISAANNQLNAIRDTTSLRVLVNRLEQARSHWANAHQLSFSLSNVLNEGEFIYSDLSRNGYTRVPPDHPSLNPRFQAFMRAQKFLVGQHSSTLSES